MKVSYQHSGHVVVSLILILCYNLSPCIIFFTGGGADGAPDWRSVTNCNDFRDHLDAGNIMAVV